MNAENQHEVQASYTQKGRNWEHEAAIELFDSSKMLSCEAPCGICLRGHASRMYAQKSFNVYFRDSYGTKKMEYPLLGDTSTSSSGEPVTTYKSFCLRLGGNDAETLGYRDSLLQETLNEYDYATQVSRPAIVFLKGEFYGIYSLAELKIPIPTSKAIMESILKMWSCSKTGNSTRASTKTKLSTTNS